MDLKSILVIRRDNIGDLILTTPLFDALRERWPHARIDALVNAYNAPVLLGNPALDHVYQYTKAKHRAQGESLWRTYLSKAALLWRLRQVGYERVVLANSGFDRRGLGLAHWIGAGRVLGFAGHGADRRLTYALAPCAEGRHHVESLWPLAEALGVTSRPSVVRIVAAAHRTEIHVRDDGRHWVAVHISARKPSQRWPVEAFIELIGRLCGDEGVGVRLFWSPGAADDPKHPGDDAKAAEIITACHARGLNVDACVTQNLSALIAGLAQCRSMICSDGGAMHVGAALGLPIVCLFGESDAKHWRPWGVKYRVLQPPSRQVVDVSVLDVWTAWKAL